MLTSEHILEPITTTQIEQASARIRGSVLRTPIVRLNIDSDMEIYLKLENLQPTGSFKVRGACNAIALAGPAAKSRGVYTCSAGNMAQALAWQARQNSIPCTAIVPVNAPKTKLQAIERFGAKTFQEWIRSSSLSEGAVSLPELPARFVRRNQIQASTRSSRRQPPLSQRPF